MKRTFALVAVAGVAALAQGQTMQADLQFSTDGGATWGDLVNANPGATVDARINMIWSSPTAICWGGMTITQIDVAGSFAGDLANTFGGKLNPSTETFKLYNPGATAKIDRLDNPSGSIQLSQLAPNFGGDTSNPIVAFTFKYVVDGAASGGDIVFSATQASMTLAQLFTTAGGTSQSVAAANRSFNGGTIHVTPAPGAIALVGLSGLVAGRRRRA